MTRSWFESRSQSGIKLADPSLWPGEPERRLGGRPILGFSFSGVTRGGWVCSILLAVA